MEALSRRDLHLVVPALVVAEATRERRPRTAGQRQPRLSAQRSYLGSLGEPDLERWALAPVDGEHE